jgi:hypothetical protein
MSQIAFVFDAEKFGLWLREECARQGIKDGRDLHRRLIRVESEITEKTAIRWYRGENGPHSSQIPDILRALDVAKDGAVYERFEPFMEEQLEALRRLVTERDVRQPYLTFPAQAA